MSDEMKEPVNEQPARDWADKITQALGKFTTNMNTQAQRAIEASKEAYTGSELEKTLNDFCEELEARGITQQLTDGKETIGEKLDEVTGKRLLDLLEVRLMNQDMYNDVLATRLAEALDRISQLEQEMQDVKRK